MAGTRMMIFSAIDREFPDSMLSLDRGGILIDTVHYAL